MSKLSIYKTPTTYYVFRGDKLVLKNCREKYIEIRPFLDLIIAVEDIEVDNNEIEFEPNIHSNYITLENFEKRLKIYYDYKKYYLDGSN